nr:PREDICTED: uncharacterized protein LOC100875223 isoform X5 [Megachile rotundata]
MFMVWGDWFTGGVQTVDTQNLLDSVIITNKTIIRRIRVPTYEVHRSHWRNGEILRIRILKYKDIIGQHLFLFLLEQFLSLQWFYLKGVHIRLPR